MSGLKVFGGLLGLVAGVLAALVCLDLIIGIGIFTEIYMLAFALVHALSPWATYINLALAVLALIGGILGMSGSKGGGALLLVVGVVWLIGGFAGISEIFPYSAIFAWTGQLTISGSLVTVEAICCLLGGIFILAGGDD